MFIPSSSISDWKDLQKKTAQLFAEMEYSAEIARHVTLAGRGAKEIDVFVTDPNASYNKIYLIECKFWDTNVPQEVVHSFKTVMEETGANTGFIVSKVGFQSGAYEAARYTNIHLLTFEELQHTYGNEWFRKQRARLDKQIQKLILISNQHFDQWNMLGFHGNMFFTTDAQKLRLLYFQLWIKNLILDARGRWPESYIGPEPVQISNDPWDPERDIRDWFKFPTVRDYFRGMTNAATACVGEFELFREEAIKAFDMLPENQRNLAMNEVLSAMRQESPIRILKNVLPAEEYSRILKLLDETD